MTMRAGAATAPLWHWASRRWVLLGLMWLLACSQVLAQAVLPVPELRARVMDQTGTLEASAVAAMEARLAAFEQEHGAQVVVLMVATTAPEDIADYTQRLGDAWKIGRRDVGDGLLFVIAKDDRRMRIAPAKRLEGAIPDLMARRILDQAVAPAFRKGDYDGGIQAGLDQILALIAGEALPAPSAQAGGDDMPWQDLLIFGVVALPIISGVLRGMFGNRFGSLLTGAAAAGMAWHLTAVLWIAVVAGLLGLLLALVMQVLPVAQPVRRSGRGGHWGGPGGGWGSGGNWGGGGGGFSSGGGGNFGGGGASGSW